jgi:hypothetical protein
METKRDLSFEINNAKQLNEMLTGVLMDVRRGNLDHDTVKSITLVADKINKNNVNILEYKKITKHKKEIDFFEPLETKEECDYRNIP